MAEAVKVEKEREEEKMAKEEEEKMVKMVVEKKPAKEAAMRVKAARTDRTPEIEYKDGYRDTCQAIRAVTNLLCIRIKKGTTGR
ncbi:hypothetical protein [Haladaptatus sp. DYF46]|uniref:hypothetical protein n=1 Tax=Haladaptatus sp. DYF46 TaxID=2886041 RepID=UPI001E65A170|nr:hypothetical protein [Haladaptatus sp. DYF46]